MDFNSLISNPCIADLKCSLCKNYLSYFPIYLTTNNLNICGRCQIPEDSANSKVVPHIRNEVYEVIAKEVEFPCRYVGEGCMKKLLGKDIPDHENKCPLQLVKCPASLFDLCSRIMPLHEIPQHCKANHSGFILEQHTFNIDLSQSKNSDNIVLTENCCAVFKTVFNPDTKNLSCTLCFENDQEVKSETCKLCLKYDSISIIKSFCKESSTVFHGNICLKIFDNSNGCTIVEAELLIQDVTKNTLVLENNFTETALNIWKCSSCLKHIRPPSNIHFANKNTYCPSCAIKGASSLDNENFEKLANMLNFPCKYQSNGCAYKSHPSELSSHELICSFQYFRSTDCPLIEETNCKWKGLISETNKHITICHTKHMARSCTFQLGVKNFDLNSFILKFASHFFRFCYFIERQRFCFYMQMIGVFQEDFNYEIQILDRLDRWKIVTTKPCSHFEDCSSYYFTLGQLEDMLYPSHQLQFKVKIFNNK